MTSGGVSSRLAAKPHAPLTSTRTPKPMLSLSDMLVTRSSRVATDCDWARETRTSA